MMTPNQARCTDNLGMVYYAQKRYNEAKQLYLQALEIFEKKLKPDHPWRLRCSRNLNELFTTTGEQGIFGSGKEVVMNYIQTLILIHRIIIYAAFRKKGIQIHKLNHIYHYFYTTTVFFKKRAVYL